MVQKPVPKFRGQGANKKNKAQDALRDWMEEMVDWCEKARIDIIRLEGAAHLAKGDPGQPPEEPWV